jgi:hypothetical protein
MLRQCCSLRVSSSMWRLQLALSRQLCGSATFGQRLTVRAWGRQRDTQRAKAVLPVHCNLMLAGADTFTNSLGKPVLAKTYSLPRIWKVSGTHK